METVAINYSSARVRRTTFQGRQYLVAPMSLIVPGVLNGSKGPLYYPPDEVAKDPAIWNGVPIVVHHPTKDGSAVSARDPEVLENQGVGFVSRAKYTGKKLVAEGWFDVDSLKRIDPKILDNLESGRPVELSTGLYTDNQPAENGARHNGRSYSYVARNYKADHLAVFSDAVGACSLNDGCGVLVNKREEATENAFSPEARRAAAEERKKKAVLRSRQRIMAVRRAAMMAKSKQPKSAIQQKAAELKKKAAEAKSKTQPSREEMKKAADAKREDLLKSRKSATQNEWSAKARAAAIAARKRGGRGGRSAIADRRAQKQGFKSAADRKKFEAISRRRDKTESRLARQDKLRAKAKQTMAAKSAGKSPSAKPQPKSDGGTYSLAKPREGLKSRRDAATAKPAPTAKSKSAPKAAAKPNVAVKSETIREKIKRKASEATASVKSRIKGKAEEVKSKVKAKAKGIAGRALSAVEKRVAGLRKRITGNIFCKTGKGGGVDPTCSNASSEISAKDLPSVAKGDRISVGSSLYHAQGGGVFSPDAGNLSGVRHDVDSSHIQGVAEILGSKIMRHPPSVVQKPAMSPAIETIQSTPLTVPKRSKTIKQSAPAIDTKPHIDAAVAKASKAAYGKPNPDQVKSAAADLWFNDPKISKAFKTRKAYETAVVKAFEEQTQNASFSVVPYRSTAVLRRSVSVSNRSVIHGS